MQGGSGPPTRLSALPIRRAPQRGYRRCRYAAQNHHHIRKRDVPWNVCIKPIIPQITAGSRISQGNSQDENDRPDCGIRWNPFCRLATPARPPNNTGVSGRSRLQNQPDTDRSSRCQPNRRRRSCRIPNRRMRQRRPKSRCAAHLKPQPASSRVLKAAANTTDTGFGKTPICRHFCTTAPHTRVHSISKTCKKPHNISSVNMTFRRFAHTTARPKPPSERSHDWISQRQAAPTSLGATTNRL